MSAHEPEPGNTSRHPAGAVTVDLPSQSVLVAVFGALGVETRVHLSDPGSEPAPSLTPLASNVDPAATRYQYLGEIARGGMGIVFKVRDADLGREIAAKVLLDDHRERPEMLVRFVEEAQIAGQLQHPGIVPVYELGADTGNRPYFTMKLVKGETLAARLTARDDPAKDRPRLLKVFEAVCQAVAYAHSRGVIHRDLKPANVMVGSFGEVQVMDWGLAKVLRAPVRVVPVPAEPQAGASVIRTRRTEDDAGAGETRAGSVLGTPAYMPPEQALGEIDRLDRRADVFGLGAILCEILTGKPPYVGTDSGHTLRLAVRAEQSDALARLGACGADPELVALCMRCLAAEPDGRPADAGVLAGELTAYLESVEGRLRRAELAGAEARARAVEERKRRKLTVALVGAVLGLLALGAGGWYYVSEQRAERARAAEAKQAEAQSQVRDLLARTDGLRRQARTDNDPAKWAGARALVDRAAALVPELPPGHELGSQVESLAAELGAEERDRRLVARLEEVWLLRAEFDGQSAGFALKRSLREYPPLFAEHGLSASDPPAQGAAWVRARQPAAREAVIAGLDAWLGLARQLKAPEAGWLFDVLQGADDDPWRRELRAAVARDDAPEVERLSRSDALARQPAQTVLLLADYFRPRVQDRAVEILRQAQARTPADFWINFALADALYQRHFSAWSPPSEYEDAVRYFTTAAALRPDNPHVQAMLGWALWLRGRRDEGRAVVARLRATSPNYFGGHLYFGLMSVLGDEDPGEAEAFRRALELQPTSGLAHLGVGMTHWVAGRYDQAMLAVRRANRYEPSPRSYLAEAALLFHMGRVDELIAVCRRALAAQPDFAEAQLYIRLAELADDGKFEEILTLFRAAARLRPNQPEVYAMMSRSYCTLRRWDEAVRATEQATQATGGLFPARLGKRFAAEVETLRRLGTNAAEYVSGARRVADPNEIHLLVVVLWPQQRFHDLARLYPWVFADRPELVRDVTAEWRYMAARFAAMAAAGLGDGKDLPDPERARLRKQAVEWLRADLEEWRKILASGSDDDKALARERLVWWQQDPKLAVIRDPAAVAKLPPEERKMTEELWGGVHVAVAPTR